MNQWNQIFITARTIIFIIIIISPFKSTYNISQALVFYNRISNKYFLKLFRHIDVDVGILIYFIAHLKASCSDKMASVGWLSRGSS